ncbi:hypothetical protein Tco_1163928 [Tanacetum coccineum]
MKKDEREWKGKVLTIDEFTLSSLEVLQGFSFFLQMGFTLILATLDGLDVGLLEDVIGEDDCDDDDCDEEMSLVRISSSVPADYVSADQITGGQLMRPECAVVVKPLFNNITHQIKAGLKPLRIMFRFLVLVFVLQQAVQKHNKTGFMEGSAVEKTCCEGSVMLRIFRDLLPYLASIFLDVISVSLVVHDKLFFDREVFHLLRDLNYGPDNAAHTYDSTAALLRNKKLIDAEAEAIRMILNGIGESINKQDVKTKLFWEFGKFTLRDGESIESYYTRFYRMMNEMVRNKLKVDTMQVNDQFLQQLQPEWSRFVTIVKKQQDLDTFSFHKLFDILKQHYNEVNEIRVERIARNANPLALVAATQHYQDDYTQSPKPYETHPHSSRQTPSTRTHATTENKGKDIVKPSSPLSELESEKDNDEE